LQLERNQNLGNLNCDVSRVWHFSAVLIFLLTAGIYGSLESSAHLANLELAV